MSLQGFSCTQKKLNAQTKISNACGKKIQANKKVRSLNLWETIPIMSAACFALIDIYSS